MRQLVKKMLKLSCLGKGMVAVGCTLMVLSVLPSVYLLWLTQCHNAFALSMPISLGQGSYSSHFFTTDYDEMEVGLTHVGLSRPCPEHMEWHQCKGPEKTLDLDWKIVDDRGKVIKDGHFSDTTISGYDILLGYYTSKHLPRQRVILTVKKGVPEYDIAHPTLEVRGHPKYSEFLPEQWIVAMIIVVVGNIAALLLFCFAAFSRQKVLTEG